MDKLLKLLTLVLKNLTEDQVPHIKKYDIKYKEIDHIMES